MDAVHRSYNRAWIDDVVINLKQFLDEWKDEVPFEFCEDNKSETFLQNLISEEAYRDIERQCGLEAMKCHYQERVEPSSSITVPTDVNLKTLKSQAEDLKKRADSVRYSSAVYHHIKYCNYPHYKILSSLTDISKIPYEPVIYPDVLLNVQVYLPERKLDPNATVVSSKMPAFQIEQEFLVLGNQLLSELRDKIECVSDKAIPGEYSDCPTVENAVTCKDLYKSGFFYINGVFYNDMRDQDCRDYSEVIIKWASIGKRGIGPFRKAIMEKTRFIDLSIQLGYPYVYTHQGECEHLMVFSDLRMLSKDDVSNKNAYPLYVQVKASKRIFCMVCHEYTSSWVVYDNKRLPENPFFFCKSCFFKFNYDVNNQKIGNFKAYHLPDHTKLS